MTGSQAIKEVLNSTQFLVAGWLGDLSDADVRTAPVPGANNIAWQMAHLIVSETQLGADIGGKYPALPAALDGIMAKGSDKTKADGGKLTKAEYLDLFSRVRAATVAAVEKMSDADLDKPNTGTLKQFAPTLGSLAVMIANHTLMHGGQFVVVRRLLGKPVLF